MPAPQSGDERGRVASIAAELGLVHPELTALSGGLSNRSWRLRDGRRDLVLRLPGAAAASLGVSHETELAMLAMAARAGLAPAVVFARPAEGLLVTRHVTGKVLTRAQARRPAMLARIGAWIARLHALAPPAGLAVIDIAARAASYLDDLVAREASPLVRVFARQLGELRTGLAPPARLVPCHHDLHHFNLLDTADGLIALDWEYAGPGDAAADLAACIGYHDLDARRTNALLSGYGPEGLRLAGRLAPLAWIFDCLCYGWMEVAARQGIAADAARRERLILRLTARAVA